ncbi:2Fe-2S iron-sulfur cluster binding domain-containing protein [candidate division KSB1 bacterium]|nr:2Fe-2S iron-sulfur cluster-binding protein [bacterium]NUM66310.1 2Fe-2S iron-sulfur cluster binding domain-containing protein [candidate division KSB1 bacterium]
MATSIIFNKLGRFEVEPGTTILQAAQRYGLFHAHDCGGQAQCTTCRVAVLAGENNCSPMAEAERGMLQSRHFAAPIRLACQTKIHGPVRVQILLRDEIDAELARASEAAPLLPAARQQAVAVLSASLQGFDQFATQVSAYDAMQALNRFYFFTRTVVQQGGGSITAFGGGRMTAIFGMSGKIRAAVLNAVNAGREMANIGLELNDYLSRHFETELPFSAGVHAGLATIGMLAFEGERLPVALGRTLTSARELRDLARAAGAALLISQPAFAAVREQVPVCRAFQARGATSVELELVFEVPAAHNGHGHHNEADLGAAAAAPA